MKHSDEQRSQPRLRRTRRNRVVASMLIVMGFAVGPGVAPQATQALTASQGVCTAGDACVSDGSAYSTSNTTTTSCRIYGWDLLSTEWNLSYMSSYNYQGAPSCIAANVDNTADQSRNRMSTSSRNICYFSGANITGSLIFTDVYNSVITWRTMTGVTNSASSFYLTNSFPCP